MGNQLANGLKTVGAKAASALPGLIGLSSASFSKPPDRHRLSSRAHLATYSRGGCFHF